MIRTLAWKEIREHQGIWITMVFMTILLGAGLSRLVAAGDSSLAVPTAAFTIFGLAAAYGVVCGSMMFAGEHEGGTLVFLDIFCGRRALLWAGKFAIGVVLVLTQGLVVAAILSLLDQAAPRWALSLVGYADGNPRAVGPHSDLRVWFLVLPVVTLEAFAWGLLGSSLTKRVLAGAAVAAVPFTFIWLFAVLTESPIFFAFRLALMLVLLAVSLSNFVNQAKDDALGLPPEPELGFDPRQRFLERWDEIEDGDEFAEARNADADADEPSAPPVYPTVANHWEDDLPAYEKSTRQRDPELVQAESPNEVLWWLTLEQAWPIFWALAGVGFMIGFIILANGQLLWPMATLLLGVACGTAAFAPEQRDLSYQFLSAQHFPLKTIWRFKILFWLAVMVLEAMIMMLAGLLLSILFLLGRRGPAAAPDQRFDFFGGFSGTLQDQMGAVLFFTVWLAYGFCCGQLFVWLCRKNILALLISSLVAATALNLWLPSLLCGGMRGWQVWAPPLTMLLATWYLMRAWTSGRIMERRPLAALVGFGVATLVWVLLNYAYRAWEVPRVGAPLDTVAFRASLPVEKDNKAAKAIQKALAKFAERGPRIDPRGEGLEFPNNLWMPALEEIVRLPGGVLELPRADGQLPLLRDLPAIRQMTDELLRMARAKEPGPAFDHIAQVLAVSRTLRNKAALASYLAGVEAENDAMNGLDVWLKRRLLDVNLLRRVADELHRHARETPPPLDCLQTECYRSGGFLANPSAWSFASPNAPERIPERWLAGSIALSLDMPWEAERRTRIWQLTWAGLFRAMETPHWELPPPSETPPAQKAATTRILQRWLPAADGPGASLTRADMFRLLDTSWLADERLFCPVGVLRDAATRARWRVDATRLAIALTLYRIDNGQPAPDLQKLVPKYVPTELPVDPYSGQPFRYRIDAPGGPEIIWSTGPDKIDHGGQNHGGHLADDNPQWLRGDFDLIKTVPQWP